MTSYPFGYGTGKISLSGLDAKYGRRMHPEYRRRLFAWIEAQGGAIGIGGGWRPTPSNTSQASRNGHSFHQTQRFADGFHGIAAVDLVAVHAGHVHRAPSWGQVPRKGTQEAHSWGLHANVHDEPWHLQPIELDSWSHWNSHGRPAFRPGRAIPGHPVHGTPGAEWPPFDPYHGRFSLWPMNAHKPVLDVGSHGDAVRYLQGVIRCKAGHGTLPVDGDYGHVTEHAVTDVQRFMKLTVDGQCGPRTWSAVDYLSQL